MVQRSKLPKNPLEVHDLHLNGGDGGGADADRVTDTSPREPASVTVPATRIEEINRVVKV